MDMTLSNAFSSFHAHEYMHEYMVETVLETAPSIQHKCQQERCGFWEAYLPFRQQIDQQVFDVDDIDAIFAQVREQAAGQPAEW